MKDMIKMIVNLNPKYNKREELEKIQCIRSEEQINKIIIQIYITIVSLVIKEDILMNDNQ